MLIVARRALARWLGPPVVRLLARTWRTDVIGAERYEGILRSAQPYILLSWHESLLPVMWHHRDRGIAAVISEARDGEYLARLARTLGYRLIRGSSSRGGGKALTSAVRTLREGIPIGLTPDGPRGPRRMLKPGVLVVAERTGVVIMPVHAEASAGWRAGSWDRFLVPLPFARVRVAYGEPFRVGPGDTDRAAAADRAHGGTSGSDEASGMARRRGNTHRLIRWLWTSRRIDARLARMALLPLSALWLGWMRSRTAGSMRGAGCRCGICRCPSVAVGNLTRGWLRQDPDRDVDRAILRRERDRAGHSAARLRRRG